MHAQQALVVGAAIHAANTHILTACLLVLPCGPADPLSLLVDNALVASWVRQGLPSDPTSVQNGTILTNSERWPLMMDPQLQGVVWIKERESKNNLQVCDPAQAAALTAAFCCWQLYCCAASSTAGLL